MLRGTDLVYYKVNYNDAIAPAIESTFKNAFAFTFLITNAFSIELSV